MRSFCGEISDAAGYGMKHKLMVGAKTINILSTCSVILEMNLKTDVCLLQKRHPNLESATFILNSSVFYFWKYCTPQRQADILFNGFLYTSFLVMSWQSILDIAACFL